MFDISKLLSLPKELIIFEILPYIYCNCKKCNNKHFFFDYYTNICMKKYIPIFHNDFYIRRKDDELHDFSVLCNKCYVKYIDDLYYPIKD